MARGDALLGGPFTLHALEGWNDDEIASLQRRAPEEVLLDVDRVRDELTRKLEQPGDPLTAHFA